MNIEKAFSDFDPTHAGVDYTKNATEAKEKWSHSITYEKVGETLYLSQQSLIEFLKRTNSLTPLEESKALTDERQALLKERLSAVLSANPSTKAKKISEVGSPILSGASSPRPPTKAARLKEERKERVLSSAAKRRIIDLLTDREGEQLTGEERISIERDFNSIHNEMERELQQTTKQDRITFLSYVDQKLQNAKPAERMELLKQLVKGFPEEKKRLDKTARVLKEAAGQANLRRADAAARRYYMEIYQKAQEEVLSSTVLSTRELISAEKRYTEDIILKEISKKDNYYSYNEETDEETVYRRDQLSSEQTKYLDKELNRRLRDTPPPELLNLFLNELNRTVKQQQKEQLTTAVRPLETGTLNSVYQIRRGEEVSGYAKNIPERDAQRMVEISTVGSLGQFLHGANIVQTYRRTSTQQAEQAPKDLPPAPKIPVHMATAAPIEGLRINPKEHNVDWTSSATQHTALAALSFQFLDGHKKNMGIDQEDNLVLFDTDQTLLEQNDYITCNGKCNPPLGQLYLQGEELSIDREILDEHLAQLGEAIDSQIPVRARDFPKKGAPTVTFSEKDSEIVTSVVESHFGQDLRFLLHGKDNEIHYDNSLPRLRIKFFRITRNAQFQQDKIWSDLKNKGLSEEQIAILKANPMLLHPPECSIAQLQALRERRARLEGFLVIKDTLESEQSTEEKRKVLVQHLDSMPIQSSQKTILLYQLRSEIPKQIERAIKSASKTLQGPIKWNQLACAAYPTLASMHEWAKRASPASPINQTLSWKNAEAFEGALATEIENYEIFEDEYEEE
ncbi:hypothetical protein JYU14_02790 [Simkania negevensis]|uniref:Uncharacterized protein n=1 Tax=Simkania negevensis TaxID=83561 RepID=A0ABS3AU02_9BACT|nr:hypothetical protein [Simkania negevensis]